MKKNCNTGGFTLIELLVVVLIIGILAAVALPQYNLAVEKARATEGMIALKNLAEAAEIYYMENNAYPTSVDQLDITIPAMQYFNVRLYPNLYIGVVRKGNRYHLARVFKHASVLPWQGRYSCDLSDFSLPMNTDSIDAKVCKQLCQTNTLQKIWGSSEPGCVIGRQ